MHHPDVPLGIEVPTVLDALRADPAGYAVTYAQGCPVLGGDDAGLAAAAAAAGAADVCVAVLGDLAGLFGRGTSGEGCDAADLRLPGRQEELLDAAAGHRHAGGAGAAGRPARTTCPARPTGWPPRSAASSPARKARPPWPTC